jgi:hypothetical protein
VVDGPAVRALARFERVEAGGNEPGLPSLAVVSTRKTLTAALSSVCDANVGLVTE